MTHTHTDRVHTHTKQLTIKATATLNEYHRPYIFNQRKRERERERERESNKEVNSIHPRKNSLKIKCQLDDEWEDLAREREREEISATGQCPVPDSKLKWLLSSALNIRLFFRY